MKKILFAGGLILVIGVGFSGNSGQLSGEKVTICHNEGNGSSHEITVSIHAVPAHLANHGDKIGPCNPGGGGGGITEE